MHADQIHAHALDHWIKNNIILHESHGQFDEQNGLDYGFEIDQGLV